MVTSCDYSNWFAEEYCRQAILLFIDIAKRTFDTLGLAFFLQESATNTHFDRVVKVF